MKKQILSHLCIVALLFNSVTIPVEASTSQEGNETSIYVDMPNNWSTNALKAAVDNGLLKGSDGMLRPNDALSRAELAAIVTRMFGSEVSASLHNFTDVNNQAWYADALSKAVAMEVLYGDGNQIFPMNAISRQEVFVVLARAFSLESNNLSTLTAYEDANQVASWAKDATAAMIEAGYVQGNQNKLNPLDQITRAEFSMITYKMVQDYINQSGTVMEVVEGNVMVNVPNVTLENVTVTGNLILGAGVSQGEIILDGVTVKGKTILSGGAADMLTIQGDSVLGEIVVSKVAGTAQITVKGATVVDKVTSIKGKEALSIHGSVTEVAVDATTPVSFENAQIKLLTISAPEVDAKFDKDTKIEHIINTSDAVSGKLEIEKGAVVETMDIAGAKTEITGQGRVDTVNVSGNDTSVQTPGTTVHVAVETDGVMAGKITVAAGQSGKVPASSSSGGGSSSGGSNSGGGNGGSTEITISPQVAEIKAAMTNIDAKDFALLEVESEVTTNHKHGGTVGSHPFSSVYCSVGEVDKLADSFNFGEKEFFMSGRANVYGLHESGTNIPIIKTEGADYTTRLLMHYPENAADFSGKIYVDILNASAGYDLEDIFRRSYEHFMREGDIYIGITSKGTVTAEALKNFDPERYEDIDWLVDNNDQTSIEDGLFWDMLSQLGTVIKERPEDLFGDALGAKVKENGRTYLTGQSQSGFYLNTYLSVFYPYINNILDGQDIFDGYFNAVGTGPTTLSTGVSIKNIGWAKTQEPTIVMMSEAEAGFRIVQNYYTTPSSNTDDWKFRLYEVAGTPHADPTSPIIPNNFEIAMANNRKDTNGNLQGTSRDMKDYKGNHVEGDVHIDEFVTAALEKLDDWARNDVAPEENVLIEDNGRGGIARDANGNAMGGLRHPKMDAPIARYYAVLNGAPGYATEGSMVYLTQDELDARYAGSTNAAKLASYKAEFLASAEKAKNAGWLVQADYDKLVAWSKDTSIFEAKKQDIIDTQTASATITHMPASDNSEIFNSTVNSVGEKDSNWNDIAPIWVPALQLNGDGTIQYVNKSGDADVLSVTYTEKEYSVSGTANLYNLASDNSLYIREDGLGYTTRILVRTPELASDFNGKVYVDILNASDKYDNESLWRRAYGMIMEEGAAYVGITSKPICANSLKLFNENRYADISFASPNTYLSSNYKINKASGETAEQAYEKFWTTASEIPYTDIGLIWDILSQAGYGIKDNSDQLFGGDAQKVYLYGQSQSGFVMNEYFRFMDYLKVNDETLPYDGFMNTVGTTYPANKINQSDNTAIAKDEGSDYYIGKNLGVPVMYVTSQMDKNEAFRRSANTNVINNGDDMWALYEITSAPHSDPAAPVFPDNSILTKMGFGERDLFPTFGQNQIITDYNSNMFVQSLLLQLDEWATNGTEPTVVPYIKAGEIGFEEGLRSPQLDAPMYYYYEKPLGVTFATSGTMVAMTEDELLDRYPEGRDQYLREFSAAVTALVNAKLLRATDAAYLLKYAQVKAASLPETIVKINDSTILSEVENDDLEELDDTIISDEVVNDSVDEPFYEEDLSYEPNSSEIENPSYQ